MATIFYHVDTGVIYGVHPSGRPISVPAGVEGIEVPETPDQIPWPVPAGMTAGREQWSRINLSTLQLELGNAPLPQDIARESLSSRNPNAPVTGAEFDKLLIYLGIK